MIRKLKNIGFNRNHLTNIYKTYIRCLLEYTSPVWGKSLTKKLANKLESTEKRALSIVMGYIGSIEIITKIPSPSSI